MTFIPSSSASPPTRFGRIVKQEVGDLFDLNHDTERDLWLRSAQQQIAMYEVLHREIDEQVKKTQDAIDHLFETMYRFDDSSNSADLAGALVKQLQAFAQLRISPALQQPPDSRGDGRRKGRILAESFNT